MRAQPRWALPKTRMVPGNPPVSSPLPFVCHRKLGPQLSDTAVSLQAAGGSVRYAKPPVHLCHSQEVHPKFQFMLLHFLANSFQKKTQESIVGRRNLEISLVFSDSAALLSLLLKVPEFSFFNKLKFSVKECAISFPR